MLKVSVESVRLRLLAFLLRGLQGLETKNPPGKPSKLTKSNKKELAKIIDQSPARAGFTGNCWQSPIIQHLTMINSGYSILSITSASFSKIWVSTTKRLALSPIIWMKKPVKNGFQKYGRNSLLITKTD